MLSILQNPYEKPSVLTRLFNCLKDIHPETKLILASFATGMAGGFAATKFGFHGHENRAVPSAFIGAAPAVYNNFSERSQWAALHAAIGGEFVGLAAGLMSEFGKPASMEVVIAGCGALFLMLGLGTREHGSRQYRDYYTP